MSVNIGTAMGYLDLDTSKFKGGLKTALGELQAFNRNTATTRDKISAFGSAATSAGRTLTTGLTLPLAGFGAASIKTTMDFDSGMSKVAAISGATGKEIDQLRAKAIEMGAKTKFSATESADAFSYMAMAGWKTTDMLDGIEGIMNLAAASGEDLATTSDIVTDSLTAFGLQAKDSSHFADVLAKASSSSNTNVSMMGETFKYVAPVAGALGYSVEDTAVAIGLMANAGIKGSQAGTSLRTIMTNLVHPVGQSKKAMDELGISILNADGTTKPFSQVMGELREKFNSLTDSEKAQYAAMLAGKEGMSGFLAIVNASEEDFQGLTNEINNANGSAEEMAGTMLDNLGGSITYLKSALETLRIKIGDALTPAVTKFVDKFRGFVEWMTKADDSTVRFIVTIAGIVAAIGPVLLIFGSLARSIVSIMDLFKTFSSIGGGVKTLFSGISKAAGATTTALKKGVSAFTSFGKGVTKLGTGLKNVVANIIKSATAHTANTAATVADTAVTTANATATRAAGAASGGAAGKILAFASAHKVAMVAMLGILGPIIAIAGYMAATGASADEVAEKITKFADNLAKGITEFADNLPKMVDSFIDAFTKVLDAFIGALPTLIPALTDAGIKLFMGLVQALSAIGEPLAKALPTVIGALVKALPTFLIALGKAATALFSALVDALKEITPVLIEALPTIIAALGQALITLAPAILEAGLTLFRALAQALIKIIPSLLAIIPKLLAAIGSALLDHFPNLKEKAVEFFKAISHGFSEAVNFVVKEIPKFVKKVVKKFTDQVKDFWDAGLEAIKNFWEGFKSWISVCVSKISEFAKSLPEKIKEGIGSLIDTAKEWLKSFWEGIKNWSDTLKTNILNLGKEVVQKMKDGIGLLLTLGLTWIQSLWSGIFGWSQVLTNNILNLAKSLPESIKQGIGSLLNTGKNWIIGFWNGVAGWSANLATNLINLAKQQFANLKSGLTSLKAVGSNWIKGLWDGISQWASTLKNGVKNIVTSLPRVVNDSLKSIKTAGKNLIIGLWNGIANKAQWLYDRIRGLGKEVLKVIKKLFGIKSPSRVMRKIGGYLSEGLAIGIADDTKTVLDSAKKQIKALKDVYSGYSIDNVPYDGFIDFTGKNMASQGDSDNANDYKSSNGGDVYNFYSPKALTPLETARQMKQAKRELELGF